MKHNDDLILLSESDESYIGICECCSTINFVYRNIAFKFKEEEFNYFKKYFDELRTEDFIFESKTGKNIFMSTPTASIVFCFSKPEIIELRRLMNEASLMLEIIKINRWLIRKQN